MTEFKDRWFVPRKVEPKDMKTSDLILVVSGHYFRDGDNTISIYNRRINTHVFYKECCEEVNRRIPK